MLSLLKNLDDFKVILASESPRRYELLTMIGLNFVVRPSHIAEVYQDHLSPLEYARENARKKGDFIATKYPEALVISADTIVILRRQILEKPQDEAHAYQLLKMLSGKTHEVITAFGLKIKAKDAAIFSHESTRVTFRRLAENEIRAYVNTGEPLDKAGAYGAQGQGSVLIEKVDGCFFNVVGLPLSNFFATLNRFLLKI